MNTLRERAVYFTLILGVVLIAFAKAEEVEASSLPTGNEEEQVGRPDPSEYNSNDGDADNYLSEEIEEFQNRQRNYDEEMQIYEMEKEEFLKNKTKHEAETALFEELNPDITGKLREYENIARVDKERFEAEWKELEMEESHLSKTEEEVAKEETELADLEAKDAESEKELERLIAESVSKEAELNQQLKEFEEFKRNLEKNANDEEKILKAKYGTCIPVPQSIRKYLRAFDEKFTRMCYKSYEDY